MLKKGCKVIVIACNSASSAAYELLKEYVRKDTHIINVIDPMVDFVLENFQGKNIGLIGTKRPCNLMFTRVKSRKATKISPCIPWLPRCLRQ